MPDPQLQVMRDNHGEYTRTWAQFSTADRIAYTVHATLHSAGKSQAKVNQDEINLGTTAVAVTKGALYFAFNGISTKIATYGGIKADKLASQSIPLHFVLIGTKICGANAPVPKDTDSNKYVLQLRSTRTNVREGNLANRMSQLHADEDIQSVRLVPTSLALSYRTLSLAYVKDRDYELLTYKLRVSGGDKATTSSYDPGAILRQTLASLATDDPTIPLKDVYWVLPKKDSAQKHAEMQLVKALKNQILEIGVSKPCCHLCAAHLEQAKIPYSTWSQVTTPGNDWWVGPENIIDLEIAPL